MRIDLEHLFVDGEPDVGDDSKVIELIDPAID